MTTTSLTIPDGTTVVSVRISAYDLAGNESAKSLCAEKTFVIAEPPPPDPTPEPPPYDPRVEIDALKAQVSTLEGNVLALEAKLATTQLQLTLTQADVSAMKDKFDKLKAGWCALKGNSLTKDVLAERAAMGGCP